MFFETERLFVRQLSSHDIQPFVDMQSNPKVMKYIIGRPKTKGESIDELKKIMHSYEIMNKDFLVMAVVTKDDSKFIGTCAIINNDGEHEIGYRLVEDCWGKGYGKEVAGGLIKFSFQSLKLNKIVAYVDEENIPSIKILHSSNFKFIKKYKESETDRLVMYYSCTEE